MDTMTTNLATLSTSYEPFQMGSEEYSHGRSEDPPLYGEYGDPSEDAEILIARPAKLYTTRSNKFQPQSQADITPPPSPVKSTATRTINRAISPAPSVTERLSPLLTRANSIISRASRPSLKADSRRDSATPSSKSASPSRRNGHSRNLPSLSDFFSTTGTSAPIQLGFSLSPRKETAGADSPFSSEPRKNRPGHSRQNSSFSATAASILGFPSASRSPTRTPKPIVEEDEADAVDELLHLDLEKELFPNGVPPHDLVPSEAYDALISNASRLFLRMQAAYADKAAALREYRALDKEDDEELEEAYERARHLKLQLEGMSVRVSEGQQEVSKLRAELAQERGWRKADEGEAVFRGVRLVSAEGEESILFDEERERNHEDSDETESVSAMSEWSAAPSMASLVSSKASSGQLSPQRWGNANSASTRGGFLSLSDENQRLKERIAELEETVNGCLGLVEGL